MLPAWIADKIDASGPCWLCLGGKNSNGYGAVKHEGRTHGAHRLVYELLVGPIPEGLELDHLCRTPSCVNPDHLEPVSSAENTRRGAHRNRGKTHCKHGHEYTPDNTYVKPRGDRECLSCRRARDRARYHANKENKS